jgi:uracil-DNA glycosylase
MPNTSTPSLTETFPFGKPILPLQQRDRKEKKAFVLGVYASAVHAVWHSPKGKVNVKALAVESEPEIFWRGENASEIIEKIHIPPSCGYLFPPSIVFNGSSGRTLDDLYLFPLGYTREDVWLCDLLPKSRMNRGQANAIERVYDPYVKKGLLPPINFPRVPTKGFADEQRRNEIVNDLRESKAQLLILLGDDPIKDFLKYYHRIESLSQITEKGKLYGKSIPINIDGYSVEVLPLVHPRQAGRLGKASKSWGNIHKAWVHRHLSSRLS